MAAVNRFIDGFNKGDMKAAVAACADEAPSSMISLRTSGSAGARGKRAAGFEAVAKKEGITRGHGVLARYRVGVADL